MKDAELRELELSEGLGRYGVLSDAQEMRRRECFDALKRRLPERQRHLLFAEKIRTESLQ